MRVTGGTWHCTPQSPGMGGHLPWKGWVMRVAAERATISREVWEQREHHQEGTGM